MTTPKFFKIYGKPRKISDNYYSVPYTEYITCNGVTEIYNEGVEDFTKSRLTKSTKHFGVHTYNGKTMKGAYKGSLYDGARRTDYEGDMRISGDVTMIGAARLKFGEKVARVVHY